MAICMTRVDFRMIHGQVAGVWIPHYSATKVVIIDDKTSKDSFVKQVLTFGAPRGCEVVFCSVDEGVEEYKKDQFGNGNIIVIFRSIGSAYEAYIKGYTFPSLNVGQTPRVDGMMHATASVFVTVDDMHHLMELQKEGVNIFFRQEISKPEVSLDSVVNKLKAKL